MLPQQIGHGAQANIALARLEPIIGDLLALPRPTAATFCSSSKVFWKSIFPSPFGLSDVRTCGITIWVDRNVAPYG
jgi:hypothetical protein